MKQIFFFIFLLGILLFYGCVGISMEFECNVIIFDICMMMEQVNEKVKKLEWFLEVKLVVVLLLCLVEGNFWIMLVQIVIVIILFGSRFVVIVYLEQKLLVFCLLFIVVWEVKMVVLVSLVMLVIFFCLLRMGEQMVVLWIVFYIDNQDVYYQLFSVFFVIKLFVWGKLCIN